MKIMWENEEVACMVKSENNTPYMLAVHDVIQLKLPFGLFGFNKRTATLTEFVNWASVRCFPENRIGVKELLKEINLDKYDGWEIIKVTKAKLETDSFWIDFDN